MRLLLAAVALLPAAAIAANDEGDWVVAVYLDATGDLLQDAKQHAALLADVDQRRTDVTVHLAEANMKSEALEGFVERAARRAYGRRLLVGVMGHGVPPEAGSDEAAGAPRILVGPDGNGITPAELGDAIRIGLARAGRDRIDILALEVCYGACLEVLVELADCVGAVIAAPGEVISPGLPWREIGQALGDTGDGSAVDVARGLAHAAESVAADTWDAAWSITVCDMSRFDSVRSSLADASAASLNDIKSATAAALWARAGATQGETLRHLCDAGELGRGLAGMARSPELSDAADGLVDALEALVVTRAWIGGPGGSARRAGVTLFLPPALSGTADGYNKASRLGRSTGYGRFVEAYLEYSARLLPGLGGSGM